MAEITIHIDEQMLAEEVTERIADLMANNYTTENRDTKYGIRKSVENAVKQYIYAYKDEITERAVERAASGIMRKGLPMLVNKMSAIPPTV